MEDGAEEVPEAVADDAAIDHRDKMLVQFMPQQNRHFVFAQLHI